MRVILLQDVLHQGKRGDVIDVKPGYARNFLLPQGVALPASDGNLKYFEQLKRKIDAQHEHERSLAEKANSITFSTFTRARRRATRRPIPRPPGPLRPLIIVDDCAVAIPDTTDCVCASPGALP